MQTQWSWWRISSTSPRLTFTIMITFFSSSNWKIFRIVLLSSTQSYKITQKHGVSGFKLIYINATLRQTLSKICKYRIVNNIETAENIQFMDIFCCIYSKRDDCNDWVKNIQFMEISYCIYSSRDDCNDWIWLFCCGGATTILQIQNIEVTKKYWE